MFLFFVFQFKWTSNLSFLLYYDFFLFFDDLLNANVIFFLDQVSGRGKKFIAKLTAVYECFR